MFNFYYFLFVLIAAVTDFVAVLTAAISTPSYVRYFNSENKNRVIL